MHEAVAPDEVALDDRAVLLEQLAHLLRLDVVGQVAHEDLARRLHGIPRLGDLALHRLTVEEVAVQVLDRLTALRLVLHVHEAVVLDDVALDHFSVLLEKWPNVGHGSFVGQVADKYLECSRTAAVRHVFD